jgi:hypothetical protein
VAYQAKADAPSVALQYHRHAAAPIKWHGAAEQGLEPRLKDCSIRVETIANPRNDCQHDRPFLLDQQALLP